jgi:hypothetical protein
MRCIALMLLQPVRWWNYIMPVHPAAQQANKLLVKALLLGHQKHTNPPKEQRWYQHMPIDVVDCCKTIPIQVSPLGEPHT